MSHLLPCSLRSWRDHVCTSLSTSECPLLQISSFFTYYSTFWTFPRAFHFIVCLNNPRVCTWACLTFGASKCCVMEGGCVRWRVSNRVPALNSLDASVPTPPPGVTVKSFYRHCRLFPGGLNHPGWCPIYNNGSVIFHWLQRPYCMFTFVPRTYTEHILGLCSRK